MNSSVGVPARPLATCPDCDATTYGANELAILADVCLWQVDDCVGCPACGACVCTPVTKAAG